MSGGDADRSLSVAAAADPAKQVTGVYATQLLPFFDPKAVRLFEEFEAAVYRLA